jgi:hypothetical protein
MRKCSVSLGSRDKQAQHCVVVNAIHELGADKELMEALTDEPMGKRERRIARAVLRKALLRHAV